MDYKTGEILRKADIGQIGERASFVHCGHAADALPELIEYLESLDDDRITVNKFAGQQVQRLGYVFSNPDILAAVRCSHGIGIIQRERMIKALRKQA